MSINKIKYILFLIFLIGCKQIDSGVVVEKKIQPESLYIHRQPIPHSMGKVTLYTYRYDTIVDNKDYFVKISDIRNKDTFYRKAYLIKKQYDTCFLGKRIALNKHLMYNDKDSIRYGK